MDALSNLATVGTDYGVARRYRLSDTKPVYTSRPVFAAEKTVFDRLPYPKTSACEKASVVYLDDQAEVSQYGHSGGEVEHCIEK